MTSMQRREVPDDEMQDLRRLLREQTPFVDSSAGVEALRRRIRQERRGRGRVRQAVAWATAPMPLMTALIVLSLLTWGRALPSDVWSLLRRSEGSAIVERATAGNLLPPPALRQFAQQTPDGEQFVWDHWNPAQTFAAERVTGQVPPSYPGVTLPMETGATGMAPGGPLAGMPAQTNPAVASSPQWSPGRAIRSTATGQTVPNRGRG